MAQHYTAGNMTVVGAGMAHSEIVAEATAFFGDAQAGDVATPASPYVGGQAGLKADSPMTHVALAVPGAGNGTAEAGAAVVFKALLDAKAPATASAFNLSYSDAGVVGLYGAVDAASAGALCEALVSAFKAAASADDASIAAAKTTALTAQLVALEDSANAALALASGGAAAVDAVTPAQVKAFATAALKASPSLATVGSTAAMPSYPALAKML